jgi:hypothetical protein
VRGLTDTERLALTCQAGAPIGLKLSDVIELKKRGLISVERHGDRADYDVMPDAALALRLDAAARAMTGST